MIDKFFSGSLQDSYINGYKMCGYIDRGKFVDNFVVDMDLIYWAVRSSSRRGRDGDREWKVSIV